LLTLLEAALADPERGIAELPLLSSSERQQLLREWTGAPVAPGGGEPLHRLLAARAAASPGEPAVIGGGEVLTYEQLHARAGRVARRLRALGVGPGTR